MKKFDWHAYMARQLTKAQVRQSERTLAKVRKNLREADLYLLQYGFLSHESDRILVTLLRQVRMAKRTLEAYSRALTTIPRQEYERAAAQATPIVEDEEVADAA